MHDNDSIFEQLVDRGHERLCFHHDEETGLKAIVAIHSTKLGNALGGTRRLVLRKLKQMLCTMFFDCQKE